MSEEKAKEKKINFKGYYCNQCGIPMDTSLDMSYCSKCEEWWMN